MKIIRISRVLTAFIYFCDHFVIVVFKALGAVVRVADLGQVAVGIMGEVCASA